MGTTLAELALSSHEYCTANVWPGVAPVMETVWLELKETFAVGGAGSGLFTAVNVAPSAGLVTVAVAWD